MYDPQTPAGQYTVGSVSTAHLSWPNTRQRLKVQPQDTPIKVSLTVQGGGYSRLNVVTANAQFPFFGLSELWAPYYIALETKRSSPASDGLREH